MRFIHDELNMAVGGNTYAGGIPRNIDFIALSTLNFQFENNAPNKFNIPVLGRIINSATSDMASEVIPPLISGLCLY